AGGSAGGPRFGRAAIARIGPLERRQAGPFGAGVLAGEARLVTGFVAADAFDALTRAAIGGRGAGLSDLLGRLVGTPGVDPERAPRPPRAARSPAHPGARVRLARLA